jgi:hypothetical protein
VVDSIAKPSFLGMIFWSLIGSSSEKETVFLLVCPGPILLVSEVLLLVVDEKMDLLVFEFVMVGCCILEVIVGESSGFIFNEMTFALHAVVVYRVQYRVVVISIGYWYCTRS